MPEEEKEIRSKEEIKELCLNEMRTRPNRKMRPYDFYFYKCAEEKAIIKDVLPELAEEHDDIQYREKDEYGKNDFYMCVKHYFTIRFEKGMFYFSHPERGEATYDINNNTSTINGKRRSSLVYYFKDYIVRNTYYHTNSKNMKEDVYAIGEYGEFLVNKVFQNFFSYTNHDYRNFGKILPFVKKFENMYNWEKCGIKCTTMCEKPPSVLPKTYRNWMAENKISMDYQIVRVMERDIEHFKNIITLIQEERIPNNINNSWHNLISSNALYNLVKDEGYDMRAILRYLYNYITPYEQLNASEGLRLLNDYAAMHRQMEVPEFKRYPKYLKSNHDIIQGEFNNYKKEYSQELFEKNIDKGLVFIKEKVVKIEGEPKQEVEFIVEVPHNPEDLKEEGKTLSHCVGSYIQRVIDGETQILFLRKMKGVPMVTLELRENVLIQAKGYANRNITKEERKYIHEFAKEKKLLVRI